MKHRSRRQLPDESLVSRPINQQIDLLASMFELTADARTGSFRTLTPLRTIGFPSQQATAYPKQQFAAAKMQSTENKEQSNFLPGTKTRFLHSERPQLRETHNSAEVSYEMNPTKTVNTRREAVRFLSCFSRSLQRGNYADDNIFRQR